MTRCTTCLLAALVQLSAFRAVADPIADAEDYVCRRMRDLHIPGLSIAVLRNGKEVMIRSYGKADLELDAHATNETVFEIASVSKPFIATAVMMLVREGKMRLDDPIGRFLPGLPLDWDSVTVKHLMTHTSGIKDYTSLPGFILQEDLSDAELIRRVARFPLEFRPGSDWSYSNTGYALLGMIITKVSGRWFGDYLEDHIFRCNGMTMTRVNAARDIIRGRASGYVHRQGRTRRAEWVSPSQLALADTALITTIADMARWESALSRGKILPPEDLKAMWTQVVVGQLRRVNYGLGWYVEPQPEDGITLVGHDGLIAGYSADVSRFIRENSTLTVIILTNGEFEGEAVSNLSAGVSSFFLQTPSSAARPNQRPEPRRDVFKRRGSAHTPSRSVIDP